MCTQSRVAQKKHAWWSASSSIETAYIQKWRFIQINELYFVISPLGINKKKYKLSININIIVFIYSSDHNSMGMKRLPTWTRTDFCWFDETSFGGGGGYKHYFLFIQHLQNYFNDFRGVKCLAYPGIARLIRKCKFIFQLIFAIFNSTDQNDSGRS